MTRGREVNSKVREQSKHRKRFQRKVSSLLVEQHRRVQTISQAITLSADDETSDYQPEPEKDKAVNIEEKLRIWKIKHNVTRNAMNDLLRILVLFGLTSLPLDCRTIMKTPENLEINVLPVENFGTKESKAILEDYSKVLTKI